MTPTTRDRAAGQETPARLVTARTPTPRSAAVRHALLGVTRT